MILNNQIAFISCVNDENMYSKCLKYVNQLNLPKGYSYETIAIRNAKSLTSGYNEAMLKSSAKYKVYLHQDTYIINRNFIHDLISIFAQNPQVGLLGVAGAESLRINGIWGKSKQRYGKLIENATNNSFVDSFRLLEFKRVPNLKPVQCVDGLLIITQYDIPWRQDIFCGWHFYDISQCMEFKRAGYQVCIPEQIKPWCIHDCGVLNKKDFDKYRYIFLKEYSHDLFGIGFFPVMLINKFKEGVRPYTRKIELAVKEVLRFNR